MIMDPQFNSVTTNSLELVGRKKMKPKYGKQDWREDGDSAHWVSAKRGRKKISKRSEGIKAGASGRTAKYTGKRKRVTGK